jgi:hypothetical protein
MKKINRATFFAIVVVSIFIAGFAMNLSFGAPTVPTRSIEQPVITIALTGPLADASAEVSGMAWYGDYLIILPQYPNRMSEAGNGVIYALRKADILTYLDSKSTVPLEPIAINLVAPGLWDKIDGYEGFESIGFSGNRAFLTIESRDDHHMLGYLVSGQMNADMSKLVLDTSNLAPIEPQSDLSNKADEALIVLNDRIVTFYEVNGFEFNSNPIAHVFNFDLQPQNEITFPSLEYRLTDAALEPDGKHFWVINSLFLGDFDLRTKSDPLVEAFGEGQTHTQNVVVERLVEMKYDSSGVTLTDTAPIQLELNFFAGNNWEGLVLLDERGFLLMTDKFPGTILGFVPMP